MAFKPSTAYPGQIDTSDATGYPYGAAKNDSVPGDGQGSPLEKTWVSDLWGFEQALLAAAKITPTGVPDKNGASQYLDAIRALIEMAPTTKARNWPERAIFSAPTNGAGGASSPMAMAWAPTMGVSAGPLYAAIGTDLGFVTSEDGVVWTERSSMGSASFNNPNIAYGLISGVPNFVISGNGAGGFYKTADGISNTFINSGTMPVADGVAVWSGSLWVFAGNSGAISTSPDGVTWTTRTTPGTWVSGCGGASRIVHNGSIFVVLPLGSYNKCLTSSDGVTWTERVLGGTGIWTGLAYGTYDGLWMAIGNGLGYSTSSDGITWTLTGGPPTCNDLAVIGPAWVMVTNNGSFGGIAYSINKGANWTAVAVGNHRVSAGWKRILAADNRFIVGHTLSSKFEFALSLR